MGRAKLKMELITKEKSRNATFKKRKEGLLKKLYEFTTLCNVNGLMIMYGPKQGNGSDSSPEIWTNSSGSSTTTTKSLQQQEIHNLIDEYKKENSLQSGSTKTFGLSDYFVDRNKKVEEEFIKLRKMNMEKKYPCWLEFMDQLSEFKLRDFLTLLDDKVENVKTRINLLKGNFTGDYNLMEGEMIDLGGGQQATRLNQLTHYNDNVMVQGGMEYGDYNQLQAPVYPYYNSIVNHHQEMRMLMMNENDWQYNNGASSSSSAGIGSNNMRCALMKYETMMTHNMMGGNNQLTYSPYVAPTILQPTPCMMMPSPMPQMQHSWIENEPDEKAKFSPYMRK
ncbi:hypothetical protein RDI58_003062 [Solanum bulbocastanum]|uniref:MADS-box domain-containing protein n=1 Tax=Solanum bulbocastanum TaxID=147425 RepID=A0AAN8YUN9_SOLBU